MFNFEKISSFFILRKHEFIIVAFITSINIFVHLPELLNKYFIYPDVIYLFPYYRYSDHSLFSNTIVNSYIIFFAKFIKQSAILFDFLFGFLSKISSISIFPKVISIFYGIITALIVYFVIKKNRDVNYALGSTVIFLTYALSTDAFWGGLERGCGYMATTIFFLAFISRNYSWMLTAIAISMLSYLTACPGMLLASFALIVFKVRQREGVNIFFIISIIIMSIFLFGYAISPHNLPNTFNHGVDYKYLYSPPLIKSIYKYGGKGYFLHMPFRASDLFFNCFLNLNEHLTFLYSFITLLFIGFGGMVSLLFRDFRKILKKEIWIFLIAYIFVFMIVSVFYSPLLASRTVVSGIPILIVFLFCEAIYYILNIFNGKKMFFGVSLIFLSTLLFFYPHNNTRDYRYYQPLYDYIEKLPKDAFLAGTIKTLEPVPFFSRRSVFYMTCYSSIISNEDFYNEVEKRKMQLLAVLYGDSIEEIEGFINTYGITHIVIEKKYFEDKFLDNEWDSTVHGLYIGQIKDIVKKNKERHFPILDFGEISDFKYKDIIVVDAEKITDYIKIKTVGPNL